MIRPTILSLFTCYFLKYLVFFTILGFLDNRFKTLVLYNTNGQSISSNFLFYILYVFFFIFLMMCCCLMPLYFTFKKIKNILLFLFLISCILVLECIIYTFFASQPSFTYGIINAVISILFLSLFFLKHIKALITK
jgi:hypothetical protein